jgi:hypothetical protein
MEVSGQLHAITALPQGKQTLDTHWIGGWVGHRGGLNVMEKKQISCPFWEWNPDSSVVQPVA